ncbi:hypothetical protein ACSBR1_002047 [Camellia fascicularis]
MANDGQKEKIGDDIPSGNGKHVDPNIEEENPNEGPRDQNPREKDVGQEGDPPNKASRDEYYDESDLQVWKDRCLRRDGEMKGMTNKLVDLQSVVNFMIQNNVMQPPFSLKDTPIPAAKNDAQKGGQKTIPAVPQHDKVKEHSRRLSWDAGKTKSRRGESQRTPQTKGTYVKEHRHVQGKELCFDTVNEEKSKRTHNDAGSSDPKRLKSIDSQAPSRTKEDLRDYLQRKR